MSPTVRWIIAVVSALILIACIVGVGAFAMLTLAFGSDSCDAIVSGPSTFLMFASPIVMIAGVLAGAVMFGLKKRLAQWLGALAGGVALGIFGYVVWFILVSTVWCN